MEMEDDTELPVYLEPEETRSKARSRRPRIEYIWMKRILSK